MAGRDWRLRGRERAHPAASDSGSLESWLLWDGWAPDWERLGKTDGWERAGGAERWTERQTQGQRDEGGRGRETGTDVLVGEGQREKEKGTERWTYRQKDTQWRERREAKKTSDRM